jgi:alkylation response protein AidB-like acyl-CoA dehydrogenase
VLGTPGDGFRIALAALDGGRIGIASQATGTIQAALEASTRYAKDRRAFGVPIAEHQAVAFQLADMAVEHATARLLALRAAALKEAGQPFSREAAMAKLWASEAAQRATSRAVQIHGKPHTRQCSIAKLYASEACNRICNDAVQIHGGYGYTAEFPVERYFRDAKVQTLYEGTSEVQRLVIARDLLR